MISSGTQNIKSKLEDLIEIIIKNIIEKEDFIKKAKESYSRRNK
jgi:hypothetical protein